MCTIIVRENRVPCGKDMALLGWVISGGFDKGTIYKMADRIKRKKGK